MIKIIPKYVTKMYQALFIHAILLIVWFPIRIKDGYDPFIFIILVLAILWVIRVYWLQRTLCLEYGNDKIVVRRISRDRKMFFKKRYTDVFKLLELDKYGFSKDLLGKNIEQHKIVMANRYANTVCKMAGREIVFMLKDGRKIPFESANFTNGQLYGLVSYIESITGIKATGMLAASLLTNKFTDEEIECVYDMIRFPKDKLKDIEFRLPSCNTYFTKEGVVIDDTSLMAYIPYDKLQAITFHKQPQSSKASMFQSPRYYCCYWLKNGKGYHHEVGGMEEFKKIAGYIQKNHPEIEADQDVIYEGVCL